MKKTHRIIYWVSTIWLSLGMVSTGIVQIMGNDEERDMFSRLGYPPYLMMMLGVLKVLGVVVVLIPRTPVLKEWAYAGFFFAMFGAMFSHIASGTANELFGSTLLIVLTIMSWYFRPPERKLTNLNHIGT
ncbi:MAG TPA: DoxX family protein [Cyclobacteriaceae bacterium]